MNNGSDQRRRTPPWLFKLLEKTVVKQRFKLDAAADAQNRLCTKFYSEGENGLLQPWANPTFCNPGFAEFGRWTKKAVDEAREKKLVACLIGPKGCSQRWFHEFARQGTVYAPDDRLVFFDSRTGKPTVGAREDSMVYVFGPRFWNPDQRAFRVLPLAVRGLVVKL